MRALTIGFLFLSCVYAQAQTFANYNATSNLGGVSTVNAKIDKDNEIGGSTYLFKDWDNSAKIYADNGKIINVKNINFNASNSMFASKISKDSVFNFYSIYKVEVNGKQFENIDNKFYEVLYTFDDNHMFLKAYFVKIKPELHIITSTVVGPGKYVIEDHLYLYENENLVKFWPSRKNVLNELNSDKSSVTKYAKKHGLSFSKAEDIAQIFKYYDTL